MTPRYTSPGWIAAYALGLVGWAIVADLVGALVAIAIGVGLVLAAVGGLTKEAG